MFNVGEVQFFPLWLRWRIFDTLVPVSLFLNESVGVVSVLLSLTESSCSTLLTLNLFVALVETTFFSWFRWRPTDGLFLDFLFLTGPLNFFELCVAPLMTVDAVSFSYRTRRLDSVRGDGVVLKYPSLRCSITIGLRSLFRFFCLRDPRSIALRIAAGLLPMALFENFPWQGRRLASLPESGRLST